MDVQNQQSVLYFTILIVIEVVVLILSLIFESSLIMFNIIRIISLIGAKCMNAITWVVQYIIFALICALYSFDPVGLWITGHGQLRTGTQNAFCFIIFLLLCIATYIGFLYYRSYSKEMVDDFVGQGYSNPNEPAGGFSNPFQGSAPPQNNGRQGGFQQFTGQAYALG